MSTRAELGRGAARAWKTVVEHEVHRYALYSGHQFFFVESA
jgi:hypothetical protein